MQILRLSNKGQPATKRMSAKRERAQSPLARVWQSRAGPAEALGANLLWSEDLNPGQRFGALGVRNPFQEP